MRLESITAVGRPTATTIQSPITAQATSDKNFGEALTKALDQVNSLQTEADSMAQTVAIGGTDKVHEAMIAMEKASLALELTVQVRNKAIEAYQELMRTQV
jgi:flagellar hook-basal body complex protein FliE